MLAIVACIMFVGVIIGASQIMTAYVRFPRGLTIPVVILTSVIILVMSILIGNTIYGGFEMYEVNHQTSEYQSRIVDVESNIDEMEQALKVKCINWAEEHDITFDQEESVTEFVDQHPEAVLSLGVDYFAYIQSVNRKDDMTRKVHGDWLQIIYYWPI